MKQKTFEGNSLEEALESVRQHFGPDAVILKTKNYTGLQGALRKNKFEVTAGVYEENLINFSEQNRTVQSDEDEILSGISNELSSSESIEEVAEVVSEQERRINQLEMIVNKLQSELRSSIEKKSAVYEIRKILKSFDLSEQVISHIVKKANFELSMEDLKNHELVYNLALREVSQMILIGEAKFFEKRSDNSCSITIICSPQSSGQTSMLSKMAQLSEGSQIINFRFDEHNSFKTKMLGMDVESVHTLHELVAMINQKRKNQRNIFIDLNGHSYPEDQTKKIISSIKNNFSNVEVFLSLSAIHSELYNTRIAQRYASIVDGLVISHLDVCLNLSALINLQFNVKLPYVFFGTGPVIPQDIEVASRESIISEIFDL